jgi:hypothetical protein
VTRPQNHDAPISRVAPPAGGGPTDSRTYVAPVDVTKLLLWLGRTMADPRVIAWPVVLLPDFLLGREAMPSDSVERYQRVEWEGPIPTDSFEAIIRHTWARSRGGRTEFQVECAAVVGGGVVASSRIVCLTRRVLPDAGHPDIPEAGEPGALVPKRPIVFGDDDIREFCEVSKSHYSVTSRTRDAQVLGFRNVLVPGPLLTIVHLSEANAGRARGSIDVWFRRPVTAGSHNTLYGPEHAGGLWAIRDVATGQPRTLAQP